MQAVAFVPCALSECNTEHKLTQNIYVYMCSYIKSVRFISNLWYIAGYIVGDNDFICVCVHNLLFASVNMYLFSVRMKYGFMDMILSL